MTSCKGDPGPILPHLTLIKQEQPDPDDEIKTRSNSNPSSSHSPSSSSQTIFSNTRSPLSSIPDSQTNERLRGSSEHSQSISNNVSSQRVSPTMTRPTNGTKSGESPPPVASFGGLDLTGDSRVLSKVKQFLSTLIQFGTEISSETGEKVQDLVINLVAGQIGVSEFHSVLQDVTNFPLKPFVLPFLKVNIPLLSRKMAAQSLIANQSCLQYLRTNPNFLSELNNKPSGSQVNGTHEATNQMDNDVGCRVSNGKRKSCYDSDGQDYPTLKEENAPAPKRCKTESESHSNQGLFREFPQNGNGGRYPNWLLNSQAQRWTYPNRFSAFLQHPIPELSTHDRTHTSTQQQQQQQHQQQQQQHQPSSNSNITQEDEWKNIHVMLNCIMGMVDKTKRALNILQQRSQTGLNQSMATTSLNFATGLTSLPTGLTSLPTGSPPAPTFLSANHSNFDQTGIDPITKRTFDMVVEVKKKAEEAVAEVKRAALIEVQKAIALAEQKNADLLMEDRLKTEKMYMETNNNNNNNKMKRKSNIEINKKHEKDSDTEQERGHQMSSCWNCGRQAFETCSGCNLAKYCSRFCQHKDWDGHHKVCSANGSLLSPSLVLPSSSENKKSTSKSKTQAADGLENDQQEMKDNFRLKSDPVNSKQESKFKENIKK